MPVALVPTAPAPAAEPRRKRWTRQEIEIFERTGAMDGQHFELIEGDLINKMGKHKRHTLTAKRVVELLTRIFGWERIV